MEFTLGNIGGVLSIALSLKTLWEAYVNRARFIVYAQFDCHNDGKAHRFLIKNNTKTAVTIVGCSLFFAKNRFTSKRKDIESGYEGWPFTLSVQAGEKKEIEYGDQYYFNPYRKGKKLYMKIHTMERKAPYTLYVSGY